MALALVLLAALAAPAVADYQGWADTGWTQIDKRDCCDAAVSKAQEDSVKRCRLAGGFPDFQFRRSSSRGSCTWDRRSTGGGDDVYRCKASAAVDCK